MSDKWTSDARIQLFREYLKIPSVHPDIDYTPCVEFLSRAAAALRLPVSVWTAAAGRPTVVVTWTGAEPALPAVALYSHMDVVPVYEESWTYPPFDAHMTEDGWIYARGAQDMKCVAMQHLEAVRSLKEAGVVLKRTVHIIFGPDEEIGGAEGMAAFAASAAFRRLNVGLHLDESMPTVDPHIVVHYGERSMLRFKITCGGAPGHGCALPADTAGEKFHYILDKFTQLRATQLARVTAGAWLGDVTSVNLTVVEGGVQGNVIPASLSMVFDVRLPPDADYPGFLLQIDEWCKEAGDDVKVEFTQKDPFVKKTDISDANQFWVALRTAVEDCGIALKPLICPGSTDARFLRARGIPAFGFSPLMNTPPLLHGHDERIHADTYLEGVEIMTRVVAAVANV